MTQQELRASLESLASALKTAWKVICKEFDVIAELVDKVFASFEEQEESIRAGHVRNSCGNRLVKTAVADNRFEAAHGTGLCMRWVGWAN